MYCVTAQGEKNPDVECQSVKNDNRRAKVLAYDYPWNSPIFISLYKRHITRHRYYRLSKRSVQRSYGAMSVLQGSG